MKDFHNDLHFKKICPDVKQALTKGGLDDRLATHVASLFIRSPIPVYEKEIAFPCCEKEAADEIIEKIKETNASPAKMPRRDSS